MEKILIKNGRVLDPASKTDRKTDILIENGYIKRIGDDIVPTDKNTFVVYADGLTVAPGLIDVHVHFRDPGFTYKEDIHTGSMAAKRGGFTTVVMMANTKPAMDNENVLKEVLGRAAAEDISIFMVGNVTVRIAGKELTDFRALKEAGAKGLSDDGFPIIDKELMRKALIRAKELDMIISLHEEDPRYIIRSGINAGPAADAIDYGGADRRAEIEMVKRDIGLVRETGGAIDIQHISAGESVELVREAKKEGLKVYAEATPHHFTLTEDDVERFGSNCKMNPPLREERDRLAIIEGLKDGTIDMIATDHAPHSAEEKSRDLKDAPSGIIGLETSLALGITELVHNEDMPLSTLIERMTHSPARIYGLDKGYIAEGADADLVIFDENEEWIYDKSVSRSSNSPFLGWKLRGRVHYTIAQGRIVYDYEKEGNR
ncbi:MAG: dihydroorotase [Lachnospiraceae bacterium]|nr:dihydroorotase [Lachnospiraceae bacterium]